MARRVFDRSWIERARLSHGYTQQALADMAGISVSTYNRVEQGLITPDIKTGLKICEYLSVSPRMFLTEHKLT